MFKKKYIYIFLSKRNIFLYGISYKNNRNRFNYNRFNRNWNNVVFSALTLGIAKNPSLRSHFFAFFEAIRLLALMMALLLLYVV